MSDAVVTAQADTPRTLSAARASVGGAGGGTGLVAISHAVGQDTVLGAILLWLAPTASVLTGVAFYYAQALATRYWERRLVKKARHTLEGQLKSQHTSAQHKERLRKMLEELDIIEVSNQLDRIRFIATIATPVQDTQPAPAASVPAGTTPIAVPEAAPPS